MADDNKKTAAGTGANAGQKSQIIVPQEVQEKFPDLVPQVLESPSMDDEERKYWFSVLPIMTPDQVEELRDILRSEQEKKKQGDGATEAAIDPVEVEKQRMEKRQERLKVEKEAKQEDEELAASLLDELEEVA